MRIKPIPSRPAVWFMAMAALGAVAALLAGQAPERVALAAAALLGAGLLWAALDLLLAMQAWRRAPLQIERSWPHALALGVPKVLTLSLVNPGKRAQQVAVFDAVDTKLAFDGLPQQVTVPAGKRVDIRYVVTPRQRGAIAFGPTQLRLSTPGRSFDLYCDAGVEHHLHVYPNFAAVARYAWLAGDRRLAQIGIKTYAQRGAGTDFKQLADYRAGDPVRHIDWKATQRHGKPIVRQFQDERDQCVIFMLDCGRRMRADEGAASRDGSHFDQALNAVMLLSYVALKEGDEVGAVTFGTPPGEQRSFAPRKGHATLNALMAKLHDVEPSTAHSDYLVAAQDLLRRHPRRALVVVLTNFRDEDAAELQPALKLLRSRHLVMLASLRERALREMTEQPLEQAHQGVDTAAAHWFEQSRRDAFRRVTNHDPLAVDVEPAKLAVALVNQYHAVKRSGLL